MPDGGRPGNLRELASRGIRERSHDADRSRMPVLVDRYDAHGLLSTMLKGVQPQLNELNRVRMPADAKNAAHEERGESE